MEKEEEEEEDEDEVEEEVLEEERRRVCMSLERAYTLQVVDWWRRVR